MKDAEAELRELTAALDLAPVMVRDLDGRIRFWGSGVRDLYGFDTQEALGRVSHELLQTRFPLPLEEIQARLLREGHWRGELRHRRKSGEELIVASVWALRKSVPDSPASVVEVNNDITEIRRAELDHLRLAAIVESCEDAIVGKDLNGVITSWNPAAERILGYRAEEMIGKNIAVLAPPGHEAEMPRILERLRRGERISRYETRRRRKDGAIIDVSLTISPIRDSSGAIVGASKIARDITERKRTEDKLRDSEQRFRALLENSPRMMWVNRPEGTVEYWNAVCREYLGELATISDQSWENAIHPDDRPGYLATRQRALAEGRPYETEYRRRRTDGTYRWHVSRISPVRRNGTIEAWTGTATDVDDMRRLTAVLEQRVAERTRGLAEANAELEMFAYSVAHDLRAPLRSIRGFSQALLEDYGERLDATGRDFAERILRSADHLDALINDLLAYSRLSRGDIRPEPTDLGATLLGALEQLRGEIAARAAEVRVEGRLPWVLGQRSILQNVWLNLLDNAIKFVPPGTRPQVTIRCVRDGATIRVEVADNGIGFEAKHADRIFRVFERLHGMGSSYPGTGVGLAIVKKGIERLGGRVGVASQPGKGSRFWFELPASGA